MRRTRMHAALVCHSHSAVVVPLQSKMRNGMEEVVGSIPTRSTKSPDFMPAVYILQSQSNNRFYIGCAEDPVLRLTRG